MSVLLNRNFPAIEQLQAEGCAIRYAPDSETDMRIGVLNLMPNHAETERHWLRLLSKIPQTLSVEFIRLQSWLPANADTQHIEAYYHTLSLRSDYDALIITGAPLGTKEYEEVPYWSELREIFDMATYYAHTTLYSCWAANAAVYHYYNIPRRQRAVKLSGIYEHRAIRPHALLENVPHRVQFPHSRYAEARQTLLFAHPEVRVIMHAANAGVFYAVDEPRRRVFMFGHPEYEADTLLKEFKRDYQLGKNPHAPEYYFVDLETLELPEATWQESGAFMLDNWLKLWAK